jgi:hypothetical protein
MSDSPVSVSISTTEDLLTLIHNEDWEAVTLWIPRIADLKYNDDSGIDPRFLVLTSLCQSAKAPLYLYQDILSRIDLSDTKRPFMRTLLHHWLETSFHTGSPQVVSIILEADPQSIHVNDLEGLRPIDIVTQMILMWEERSKYSNQDSLTEDSSVVLRVNNLHATHSSIDKNMIKRKREDSWESVRRILVAHAQSVHKRIAIPPDLPLVHASLASSPDIPYALVERVLRLYGPKSWLSMAAPLGTPLHWIAATRETEQQTPAINMSNAYSPYSPIDDEWLVRVLDSCPSAAQCINQTGQSALETAWAARRTWSTGCRDLLEANPSVLCKYKSQWSFLLPVLVQKSATSIVWSLLVLHPEIAVQHTE